AEAAMERFLSDGLEAGRGVDAGGAQTQTQAKGPWAIRGDEAPPPEPAGGAQTETQAKALWAIRENQSPAQKPEGATWKHDIAVPVSQVPAFLAEATAAMQAFAPGARIAAFGPVGGGNLHDVLRACGGSGAEHSARRDAGSRIVHDIVHGLGGSISAEHGLGSMKTAE